MKIIICKNHQEMSAKAAEIVKEQIVSKPDSVLGLATGSTPIEMYANLCQMNLDFSAITTFNLDEYYPIKRDNDQSYYYFMNEHLYSKVNLKAENINIPNGESSNPDEECENYEKSIDKKGGIDLQVLGIGQNGHIGFNEPEEELFAFTHMTGLTESTINANAKFFESKDMVPTKALTMGVATIMKARKIILLASGKEKNAVIKKLLENKITTNIPATVLCMHPDVTILCDESAIAN